MKKNKIITSIGVVLVSIGVVGGVWSGIVAMPKMINNWEINQEKETKPEVIYNNQNQIRKLNIDANVSNVYIKKSNTQNVIVERCGNKSLSTVTVKNNNNELVIKEEQNSSINEIKPNNINNLVEIFLDNIFSSDYADIVIYLPEKVSANIKADYRGLVVVDDVLSNTLNYETSHGYISLLGDINLENLNIKSLGDISLRTDEINGIKNINITANTVHINGDSSTDDISKIPENVIIKTTSTYYNELGINLDTSIPIAKNVVIDSSSMVSLNLPLVDYKFNFDINTSRGIKFEAADYEKYKNTFVGKYFEQSLTIDENALPKELKGLINEELKDNSDEYSVKVNSAYTTFQ